MNITDPTVWPPDLAELTCERRCEPSAGTQRVAFTAGARHVADLSPLCGHDEVVLLEHEGELAFAGSGCWCLDLADGAASSHLLFVAPPSQASQGQVTDELAAWGRLVVLWSTGTCPPSAG
jgi:hypothetical protein